ncbi:RDD family protein [Brevibacterium album]|uniref:RDD family protein n=1 Tax=Brevibacterium album TaxID=417948 RepID=UPI0009FEDBAB|nr:RDD family protein [Brevibacterium album]
MVERGESASRRAEWLTGPSVPEDYWPGRRLGFPQSGTGSAASLLRRAAGIVVDWGLVVLAVRLTMDADPIPQNIAIQSGFALLYLVCVWLLGRTPGHLLMGIGVVDLATRRTLASTGPVGLLRAFVRTLLVCLVVPVVIMDPDGRGLHDRASGAAVVRTR